MARTETPVRRTRTAILTSGMIQGLLRVQVVAVMLAGIGCRGSVEQPDRGAQLERTLLEAPRSEAGRATVKVAAAEYRELMAEAPEALRTIAKAFYLTGDKRSALDVLGTLIVRGQATTSDRLRAIELLDALNADGQLPIDAQTYQTNLDWLLSHLDREPRCDTFQMLVSWTFRHPEEGTAIDRALEACTDDTRQRALYERRAEMHGSTAAEDACDAVVRGSNKTSLAQLCAEAGGTPWKVDVAKASLGQEPLVRLRRAASAAGATSFVLVQFASQASGVSSQEACAALERAERIEMAWRSGDEYNQGFVRGRFAPMKRGRDCP